LEGPAIVIPVSVIIIIEISKEAVGFIDSGHGNDVESAISVLVAFNLDYNLLIVTFLVAKDVPDNSVTLVVKAEETGLIVGSLHQDTVSRILIAGRMV